MNVGANRVQFPCDEPPAGRGLQRHFEPPVGEPRQEPADVAA
jgi:hypothetical protein